jgi:hypothetical protein
MPAMPHRWRLRGGAYRSRKKKPTRKWAEIQFFSEESWRRQVQYAALQHINPIYLCNIGYKLNVYLLCLVVDAGDCDCIGRCRCHCCIWHDPGAISDSTSLAGWLVQDRYDIGLVYKRRGSGQLWEGERRRRSSDFNAVDTAVDQYQSRAGQAGYGAAKRVKSRGAINLDIDGGGMAGTVTVCTVRSESNDSAVLFVR